MEISSQTIKAPDDSISVSGSEKQSVESNFHEVEIFIFVRRDERFHFLMKDEVEGYLRKMDVPCRELVAEVLEILLKLKILFR